MKMIFSDYLLAAGVIGFLAAKVLIALCMEKWAINQVGGRNQWFLLAFMFTLPMALLLTFQRIYLKLSHKSVSFNVRNGIAQ
jgi:hypothetical protein